MRRALWLVPLLPLLATRPARAGDDPAVPNCRDPANNQRCSETLVRSSRRDAFVQGILRAEKARLPKGWRCGNIDFWTVKGTAEQSEASAVVTCQGPEQHVSLEFRGDVRLERTGWTVWVTSFIERVGE